MALSVSPCGNRKTWDARVRVTGGHPELLWGIGDAEALTEDRVSVERVAVDRGDQTVGYGQLLVHPEDRHTVVDAKSLHVKNPRDLPAVLEALQEHARTAHDAAVLRVSPDTHATTELAAQLAEAGYRRRDRIRRGEAGPRHLVVRLGETEGELSKRLSSETLQRCRAGLRDSGVRVRRVNAADRDLCHVGLRTQHIRELLRAVGENSVFLVATEHAEDGSESALGYLWFVHTGESAMVYRLGFTDRARQLGVDDALLLTGLVQLQQRQVHKVLAGDPDQPGQPMVLRELATEDHEVLGTWEYPLVGEFQVAGRAEKARRRFFRRRTRRGAAAEELLPQSSEHTATTTPDPASHPPQTSGAPSNQSAPSDRAAEDVDRGTAAAEHGVATATAEAFGGMRDSGAAPGDPSGQRTTSGTPGGRPEREAPHDDLATVTPIAPTVDVDPDLARPGDSAPEAVSAEPSDVTAAPGEQSRHGRTPGAGGRRRSARTFARSTAQEPPRTRKQGRSTGVPAPGRAEETAAAPVAATERVATEQVGGVDGGHAASSTDRAAARRAERPAVALVRRAVAEGRAAVRDAARW
ncbi:hypothetical protein EAE32_08835 [Kocuria tytonicola]|uniref:Uncharacterized protein n=1 Tax=Kocuria tytonicola TaxID=2055946 RepID=A0A3L9L258_9MICC|nr:hypothetical protein [Kocuria tytonicola]RLY92248.1 hypothetical protein EAE32_08835 [Kocuria tytonicola]